MGQLVFQATLGGQVNLVGPNTASTFNLNVPAVTSTLATTSGTETLTNKTLTSPTLTSPNITTALTLTGAAGTAGQALVSGGTGAAPTWSTVSATPGGSTTQVQYNNAGAFAGSSNFNFDGTRLQLGTTAVINGGTLSIASSSSSDYQLSLSDTRAFSTAPSANIVFGGKFNTAGTNKIFGYVGGGKENTTDGNNAGYVAFGTASNGGSETERARFNSTGALVFAGGTTTANGIGITFPATQSASSNANTLDDYEEGTFTPTITIETPGTFSVTYSANYGLYVKIGKLVYLNIDVRVNTFSRGTGTGPWGFATIPFPVQNNGGYNNYISSSIQFYSANISSNQPPYINLNSNNGTVLYMYTTVNGAPSGNQSDPINGSVYQLTMIYLAST